MLLAQRVASNARCCPSSRPAAPCRRSTRLCRSDRWGDRYNRQPEEEAGNLGGVEVSSAFASALREALERSDEQLEAGRGSSGDWSGSRYGRDSSPSPDLSSVVQVVATALAAARQTQSRLTAERTELDSLIVKESKQVERLEFLLEKLRSDYAYFGTIERMYEEGQGR